MKYSFILAFKNLKNQKRRTVLTFAMLSFGISLYILISGMLEGFDLKSFENLIETQTSHFKIRSMNFNDDQPYDTDNYIVNRSKVENILREMDFVKAFTPRITILAEIDNMRDASTIMIKGIDLQKDKDVFDIEKYISGNFEKGGAVIGSTLAKDMELEKGSLFYLTFRNKQGMLTSIEYTVSGIITSPDQSINSSIVYISMNEAINYMNSESVSEYAVLTDNINKTDFYKKTLTKNLSNFDVKSWKELAEDFTAITQTKKKGSAFVLLFIIIIAMVGIINTMIMSVYEKRTEIGTLKALGMTDDELKYMFIFEGLMIGIGGSLTGIILGTIFNSYFAIHGLDWTVFMGEQTSADMGIYVVGTIKSTWPKAAYLTAVILSVICSTLASYYPAKKVMKMEPVDCLRIVQ